MSFIEVWSPIIVLSPADKLHQPNQVASGQTIPLRSKAGISFLPFRQCQTISTKLMLPSKYWSPTTSSKLMALADSWQQMSFGSHLAGGIASIGGRRNSSLHGCLLLGLELLCSHLLALRLLAFHVGPVVVPVHVFMNLDTD